jgi:hypothetical protein
VIVMASKPGGRTMSSQQNSMPRENTEVGSKVPGTTRSR